MAFDGDFMPSLMAPADGFVSRNEKKMPTSNYHVGSSSKAKSPGIVAAMSVSDTFEYIPALMDRLSKAVASTASSSSDDKIHIQFELMKITLRYIDNMFMDFEVNVNKQFKNLQEQNQVLCEILNERSSEGSQFEEIIDGIKKLKVKLSSRRKFNVADADGDTKVIKIRDRGHVNNLMNALVKLDFPKFRCCEGFEHFDRNFDILPPTLQSCLLCFAAFPENAIIHKTFLMYWWVGEGFIDYEIETANEATETILMDFLDMGFIQPVVKNRRLVGISMHALIRHAVIFLAEKFGFLSFDESWNPSSNISSSGRLCLSKTNDTRSVKDSTDSIVGKLKTLINVSAPKVNWTSKMEDLSVLSIGFWEKESCLERFELDSDVKKRLGKLKNLKVLNLQGANVGFLRLNIDQRFTNLKILDLSNVEFLRFYHPLDIGQLENLIHADFSNAYDDRFKLKAGKHSSSKLQVLKGIQIGSPNHPSLDKLVAFSKLRKLSIEVHDADSFLIQAHVYQEMTELKKLRINWPPENRPPTKHADLQLPRNLEKLDFRGGCGQEEAFPVMINGITGLRKLYLSGGPYQSLFPSEADRCNVKILHLQYMKNLRMTWPELRRRFPELIYLEVVECPKLAAFLIDEKGVWVDKQTLYRNHFQELGLTYSFL